MGWMIFQGLVFLAVYWSNLEWHWVPNDNYLVVALFGVAAAFVSTLAVGWIIERTRALKDRLRYQGRPPADRTEGHSSYSDFEH